MLVGSNGKISGCMSFLRRIWKKVYGGKRLRMGQGKVTSSTLEELRRWIITAPALTKERSVHGGG